MPMAKLWSVSRFLPTRIPEAVKSPICPKCEKPVGSGSYGLFCECGSETCTDEAELKKLAEEIVEHNSSLTQLLMALSGKPCDELN